jgi:L-fuculose-phosphate aldolase
MIDINAASEALCEVGRRVWQRGFVASNDGNFTMRLSEDRVLCTPTLMSKGFMKPEDMVIVDMDGTQVAGKRRGTSEVRIHLFIYRNRPDVHSVVHVHPPHATAFTVAKRELPKCVLQEVDLFIGEIPLAPYETTGTWKFAQTIAPWVRHHDCFLLTNHGAVAIGQDPYDAYYKMETLDQYCRILLLAGQLGDWQTINVKGIEELLQLKARLGIADKRSINCGPCEPGVVVGGPEVVFPPYQPQSGILEDSPKLPPRVEYIRPAPARTPNPGAANDAEFHSLVEAVVRRVLKG